jgi:ubiquinone/menaquinone biosynthesis C-methylase UbiE
MLATLATLNITGDIGAIAAILAVVISLIAYYRSRRSELYSRYHESVENAYSGFDNLSSLRIEHWEQSHLLELPENYNKTRDSLTTALGMLSDERRVEMQVRERAIATRIFTFYEQVVYCHRAVGPADQPHAVFLVAVLNYFNDRLLMNPRLRYLWHESGGNLRAYFEQETITAYEKSAASRQSDVGVDSIGPFLSADQWQADGLHRTVEDRERYWEHIHRHDNYDNVLSLTDDPELRQRLVARLADLPQAAEVIVLGCGSRTSLERTVASTYPAFKITCSDFSGVIEEAQSRFEHARVRYHAANSTDLPWKDKFDAVIVVNSILSESDDENRQMLHSAFRALRPSGRLIGFFPTIFAAFEIALLTEDSERLAMIDLKTSMKYEPMQNASQIFYTPLGLRSILREAGFVLNSMETVFLDSDYMLQQARKLEVTDDATVVYEHFVVATRPA